MIQRLDGFMRERVNDILDRALAKSTCDFVEEVAAELPLQVIVELMGVPREDRRRIFDLANAVIGFDDPEFGGDGGAPLEALAEMYVYAQQLAAEKLADPRDDIVSALLRADVDGEQLTEQEFNLFFVLLAVAGSETTRSAIAGGVLAFDEHPAQWERLRKDRGLLPTAVEEVLRWTTPLQYFRRTATREAEVGGKVIRAGDKVVLWYVSANRDEAVFDQPYRFDVGRTPNEHLAFGHGRHFCLGANLARRELAIMFDALLERDVKIERLGPVDWMRSNFASSIKRMPVRLRSPRFPAAG
jgi:cholest-4-en-3-one 26-monooxygenase